MSQTSLLKPIYTSKKSIEGALDERENSIKDKVQKGYCIRVSFIDLELEKTKQ